MPASSGSAIRQPTRKAPEPREKRGHEGCSLGCPMQGRRLAILLVLGGCLGGVDTEENGAAIWSSQTLEASGRGLTKDAAWSKAWENLWYRRKEAEATCPVGFRVSKAGWGVGCRALKGTDLEAPAEEAPFYQWWDYHYECTLREDVVCDGSGMCGCYFDDECAAGQYCKYNDCTTHQVNQKLVDGVCTPVRQVSLLDAPAAAGAIDLTLLAYASAIETGTLVPDEGMLASARASVTEASWDELDAMVDTSLDLTFGFDFLHPNPNLGLVDHGAFRSIGDPDAALDLVTALRDGFRETLLHRDIHAMEREIGEFWLVHEDYEPMHTGRCYPHGHLDYESASPAECQEEALTSMAQGMLGVDG